MLKRYIQIPIFLALLSVGIRNIIRIPSLTDLTIFWIANIIALPTLIYFSLKNKIEYNKLLLYIAVYIISAFIGLFLVRMILSILISLTN